MSTLYAFLQIIGPYLAVIVGLGICIFLFSNIKAGLRRSGHHADAALAELRLRLKAAEDSAAGLRADLQAAEEQFRISAGAPVKSWSNISRRTQALRMLRAGEKPRRIATELGMTGGEVDLIAKVNSIVANSFHSSDNQSRDENSTFSISA